MSNFDTGLLARCEAIMHVDSLQQEFSLIERGTAGKELPWVREHGGGLLCYSPMGAGQLTDGFTAERVRRLPEEDWRRREFREPALSRNLALRDALRPIAARHETSVMSVALAWLLAWDGVTAAIVGGRRPEQIDGWIGAAGPAADRRRPERDRRRRAGDGRRRGARPPVREKRRSALCRPPALS